MKRMILLYAVLLTVITMYAKAGTPVFAEAVPLVPRTNILIAELKVYDASNTDYDFVELYNPNPQPVDVTNWLIQYRTASITADKPWVDKSSTGKDQDTRARLTCGTGCRLEMPAHGRLLVASPAAKLPNATITPTANLGFASTGGQVRLVSVAPLTGMQTQEDMVGYGKISSSGLPVATAERTPVAVHGSKGSLKRVMESQEVLIDSDDNASDFELSTEPTPGLADQFVVPEEAPLPVSASVPVAPSSPDRLLINELLPDPASPQTDDKDEFVEIINDDTHPVNLKGMSLKVGTSRAQSYTFATDITLQPGELYAIYARDSKLALSNAGSTVTLLSASGTVLDTVTYPTAEPGQAWALIESDWRWTDQPTPQQANNAGHGEQTLMPITKTAKPSKPKVATVKKPASKAAAKPKAKTVKQPKVKKVKANLSSSKQSSPTTPPDASGWVAGGLALVAGGYLVYDYRASLRRLCGQVFPWFSKGSTP